MDDTGSSDAEFDQSFHKKIKKERRDHLKGFTARTPGDSKHKRIAEWSANIWITDIMSAIIFISTR